MTVRVTQKMRKGIDAMKRELVTDNSHRDIHKRGFIYENYQYLQTPRTHTSFRPKDRS